MGSAIIGGLLSQKALPASNIIVSEPWDVNRSKIESAHRVRTTTSNVEAAKDADALVLAVKPQVAKGVCQELAASWAGREKLPLIVSIAGGITLKSLGEWFTVDGTRKPKVVRVMPNTPALVGEGACGAIAGEGINEEEKAKVDVLLQAFSKVVEWVDREELIDVVTGLSGMLAHWTAEPRSLPCFSLRDWEAKYFRFRIRPCLFLRSGRTHGRWRRRIGYATGASRETGQADLSWCGQDVG